jgi:hypothetical protein
LVSTDGKKRGRVSGPEEIIQITLLRFVPGRNEAGRFVSGRLPSLQAQQRVQKESGFFRGPLLGDNCVDEGRAFVVNDFSLSPSQDRSQLYRVKAGFWKGKSLL